MSGESRCEIALFEENIKGIKFSMSRQLEDMYTRVKSRGQKFTDLDSNEYRRFLQAFWAENSAKIEGFFLEKFKSKAYTFDTEVQAK